VPKYGPGRRRCRTWEGASATKGASPSADLSSTDLRAGELLPHQLELRVTAAPGRGGAPRRGRGRRDRRRETLLVLVLVLVLGRASRPNLKGNKFKLTQNHIALKLKFKVT
jgi:hypothetical protein